MGGEVSSIGWGGSRNWTGSWDGSMGEGGEDRSWGAYTEQLRATQGGGQLTLGGGLTPTTPVPLRVRGKYIGRLPH